MKAAQRPCSKCGVGVRAVGGPWCLSCKAEHGRADYARRKEELRARQRAWLETHPERVKERNVEYRQARRNQNKARYWKDPIAARAQAKRWVLANREKRQKIARAWYVANTDRAKTIAKGRFRIRIRQQPMAAIIVRERLGLLVLECQLSSGTKSWSSSTIIARTVFGLTSL